MMRRNLIGNTSFALGRAGQIDAILQHGPYLIVVCGGGQYIRYFNMVHGDLVWEAASEGSLDTEFKAQAAVLDDAKGNI